MAFGIYVHIPYCLQICPYCDFTKYELGKSLSPGNYVELMLEEIRSRAPDVPKSKVDTIYFGGGTPSLIEPKLILSILNEIEKAGFARSPDAEITIEIDPATVDEARLDEYLAIGINRFSVGVQTFNERLLKRVGRKHTTKDSVELLSLLRRYEVNYSFDLLFALPSQTLDEVRSDVLTALQFNPSHLSAYCLNVPEGHKLDMGRAPEDEQIEMFDWIEAALSKHGLLKYEISNFARVGFESRHNILYWTDQPYWGLGISSHSYLPPGFSPQADAIAPWGLRFWNTRAMKTYSETLSAKFRDAPHHSNSLSFLHSLPESQIERLQCHQAITDFCHTSLRMLNGFDVEAFRVRFGEPRFTRVRSRLESLENSGHVARTSLGWTMTRVGRLAANLVFEKLTFLADEF